jgi:hypothetical protein
MRAAQLWEPCSHGLEHDRIPESVARVNFLTNRSEPDMATNGDLVTEFFGEQQPVRPGVRKWCIKCTGVGPLPTVQEDRPAYLLCHGRHGGEQFEELATVRTGAIARRQMEFSRRTHHHRSFRAVQRLPAAP